MTINPRSDAGTCPACLKARTNAFCGDVRKGCVGCEIRELANMPKDRRQAAYARMEAENGEEARRELARCVMEEYARIQHLKGAAHGLHRS